MIPGNLCQAPGIRCLLHRVPGIYNAWQRKTAEGGSLHPRPPPPLPTTYLVLAVYCQYNKRALPIHWQYIGSVAREMFLRDVWYPIPGVGKYYAYTKCLREAAGDPPLPHYLRTSLPVPVPKSVSWQA